MRTVTIQRPVVDLKATGAQIKSLRTRCGYTVHDIQAVFGFEYPQAVYAWESGKSIPTIDNLLVLAHLFDAAVEEIVIQRMIEVEVSINGFKGWLQTDEYPGYEAALKEHELLYPKDKIIHVACAAHIRRKFYDALLNGKSKGSAKAIKYIQQMYHEENLLREKNLPDAEFLAKRREIIKPIMDEFYDWMIKTQPTVPSSFKFGKALKYAIDAWPHLMNYLDCPEIYLDNSVSERSIRPYVLSRKNFLFSASEDGSRSTCLLFSLIECAKIYNINPEEYLSSIFELAADTTGWTDSNWSELLPWNIKLIKKSDVSTVLIA